MIPKYAKDTQSKLKLDMIRNVLKHHSPDADCKSLGTYVSNFLRYLRMPQNEFDLIDTISFTNSRTIRQLERAPASTPSESDKESEHSEDDDADESETSGQLTPNNGDANEVAQSEGEDSEIDGSNGECATPSKRRRSSRPPHPKLHTSTDDGQDSRRSHRRQQPSVSIKDSNSKRDASTPVPADSFKVRFERCEVQDRIERAIRCLLLSDSGVPLPSDTFEYLKTSLVLVASVLAALYRNESYNSLVRDTLMELEQYEGQQPPQLPHSEEFLKKLSQYHFCVSPRMYSACEILCIAIAMLNSQHHYIRIGQKQGKKLYEEGYRGMALLDRRVQSVMYRRLECYGFINKRIHPPSLQMYSSVVINSGGCWMQGADWDFEPASCFAMDPRVEPFLIAVDRTPGVLEANGLYAATTSKYNGHPVYVQVSAFEFNVAKLSSVFTDEARKVLDPKLTDSKGVRFEVCSPRILVCCSVEREKPQQWGIQLLPGYGSELYIVQFDWNRSTLEPATARCFNKMNIDNSQSMQDCSISVSVLYKCSADCLNKGTPIPPFTFGTVKYATRDAQELLKKYGQNWRPPLLDPQAFHADGPWMYDTDVYDVLGNMKCSALSCGALQQHHNHLVAHANWAAQQQPGCKKVGGPMHDYYHFTPNMFEWVVPNYKHRVEPPRRTQQRRFWFRQILGVPSFQKC